MVEGGAGWVGGVGRMTGSCRQPPQQKRIHGAEGKLDAPRSRSRARYVVKEPCDLGGGKVWVEQKAGARRDLRLGARILEPAAHGSRAPVLPYDGIVDRLAAGAVPHHGGLALVG